MGFIANGKLNLKRVANGARDLRAIPEVASFLSFSNSALHLRALVHDFQRLDALNTTQTSRWLKFGDVISKRQISNSD